MMGRKGWWNKALSGLCLGCRRRSNPEEEEAKNKNEEPNNSPQPTKPLFTANIAQEHTVTNDVFLHYEKVKEIGIGSTCTIWTARCIHQHHTGTHDSHGGIGAPAEVSGVLETSTSTSLTTQHAPTNKERLYALKQVAKGELKNPSFLVALSNEIDILRAMDHPNIVRVHEKFVAEDAVYLVTELCVGGDLYARSPYTEGQAAHIVSQMLLALAYMHKRNICHRDLKHGTFPFFHLHSFDERPPLLFHPPTQIVFLFHCNDGFCWWLGCVLWV
jgi:serine/threonine protein kinase